jgi:5'-methylthioadenosine phosphorylase
VGTDSVIGLIGGSGLYSFFDHARTVAVQTPYGPPSADVTIGTIAGRAVAFIPRHGAGHRFSPHTVPYRANLWALRSLGVRTVIGACAVGGLRADHGPGTVVVPDQLVDRTSGRVQTFFDTGGRHAQFADPYCEALRQTLIAANDAAVAGGTMVVIEGPRFSTRAESRWYADQGWTVVNMTGHPEAVLARELGICYAAAALVTDLDAGVEAGEGVRTADVMAEFERNLPQFRAWLTSAVGGIRIDDGCGCADDEFDLAELGLPVSR